MIVIFTLPKAFGNPHINMIQENAIESWLVLKRKYGTRIILCGDDAGVPEYAEKIGVESIPDIERYKDVPLISDVFNKVQERCPNDTVVYINSDIIVFEDMILAIQRAKEEFGNFLLIGQRFNWSSPRKVGTVAGWKEMLLAEVYANGWLDPPNAVDYFAFPSKAILDMPPFLVGRYCWDTWIVSHTVLAEKMQVIDATPVVNAIHQDHSKMRHPRVGELANHNRSLLPKEELEAKGGTDRAPWVMTEKGIEKRA